MPNYTGFIVNLMVWCALVAAAAAAASVAFDNSVDVKPEATNDGDVVIDDMIYGREQYIKDYFNLR